MHRPVAIIAGEPNSISSEIIFKSWRLRKKHFRKPLLIIGNIRILNLQKKKLKYHLKIKNIKKNFSIKDLNGGALPVYDVDYKQKKPFQKITTNSNRYILKCFDFALELIKNKKISGIVNCPVSKETLFKNKYQGVTELLAKKTNSKNNEVMLIFNKKLSVAPLTTHIPISRIGSNLKISKIISKIKIIDNFYRKNLNKRPKIAVLGFNPHNFSTIKNSEERKIIIPAVKSFKKTKINVTGPISPDSSFMIFEKNKFDVIIGMYHDQVLTPFKALFRYDAINITLGLPFIRTSPDHGTAENIAGKNIANPKSLIESIKFFNSLK